MIIIVKAHCLRAEILLEKKASCIMDSLGYYLPHGYSEHS